MKETENICDKDWLGKSINGYQCYFASKKGKGRYEFSKKEDNGKFSLITLWNEDLKNGNAEFMTINGLSRR